MDNPLEARVRSDAAQVRPSWAGRILSALGIAALGLDAIMKIVAPQAMIDHSPPLGLPQDVGFYRLIGIILLFCVGSYALPRTRLFGAILITAFLGGAVAVNLRAGMPLFSHTLFGVYIGALIWGGLYLRSPKLRAALAEGQ